MTLKLPKMEIKVKKAGWKKKIRAACEEAGTYQPFFELAIEQLAQIMETKDAALKLYKESGNQPVMEYTNARGFTNMRKNPALAVIQECNVQALAYWRDLGLTPSGFKKIDGKAAKEKETSFEDILGRIGI